MIELSDIQKRYELGGEVLMALDHVDLTVGDHEYVAIIGPSGSGKSTLMNIIGCLDTADGGTYKLDGLDITRLADEPTGNLDSKTTVEIMDMLEELHAQGNAIVLITHNPEIAARAPRCVHIRDGRLSELAPGADRRKTVEGGAGA